MSDRLRRYELQTNYGEGEMVRDDTDGSYVMYDDAMERIAKLEDDIRTMVEMAAAKHRPGYDEQQRCIAAMEGNIDTLKAGLKNRDARIAALEKVAEECVSIIELDSHDFAPDLTDLEQYMIAAGYLKEQAE